MLTSVNVLWTQFSIFAIMLIQSFVHILLLLLGRIWTFKPKSLPHISFKPCTGLMHVTSWCFHSLALAIFPTAPVSEPRGRATDPSLPSCSHPAALSRLLTFTHKCRPTVTRRARQSPWTTRPPERSGAPCTRPGCIWLKSPHSWKGPWVKDECISLFLFVCLFFF